MDEILPIEIIAEIFSYVDFKSLISFNIITKDYYKDIIMSTKFPKDLIIKYLKYKFPTIQKLEFLKLLGLTIEDIRNEISYHFIFINGDLKLGKYLVSQGFTIDDLRSNNNVILWWASTNGYLEVIKYLVSQGLTLNDIRSQNNSALHNASNNGHLDVVKYLISQGLTLNDIRSFNNAALRYSSFKGHIEVVKYLLSRGLTSNDVKDYIYYSESSLFSAISKNHLEIFKYLCQKLTLDDIRNNDNEILNLTCSEGHLEMVKYLISLGLTSNDILGHYRAHNVLQKAISMKHLEIANYLQSIINN